MYLDPRERSLKSQQIGLSNHENVYPTACLVGGWVEDRYGYDAKIKPQFDGRTIQRLSYQDPKITNSSKFPGQDLQIAESVEKGLIFGHGEEVHQTSLVSMNELTFKNPEQNHKTEVAINMKEKDIRSDLLAKKRALWESQKADDRFVTSSSSTYGSRVNEAKPFARHTNKWGEWCRETRKDYKKCKLREPMKFTHTPVVNGNRYS